MAPKFKVEVPPGFNQLPMWMNTSRSMSHQAPRRPPWYPENAENREVIIASLVESPLACRRRATGITYGRRQWHDQQQSAAEKLDEHR
jgi:hypothetical protein